MKNYKVYILATLCVLFWSGNFVLGRFIKDDLEPLEMAFFRWFFVVVLLLPSLLFINLKNVFRLIKEHFFITSLYAVISVSTYNTLIYMALQSTTATNALLINSSVPIIILILSAIILKTHISLLQIGGIILSTFGVIFLILKGNFSNLAALDLHEGDFWVMLTSLLWALYSVLLKYKPRGYKNFELFIANMYLGFFFFLPFYLLGGYTLEQEIQQVKNNWHFFLYVSLFASISSYILWSYSIEHIGASKTGQFTHLMPLFGSILAFIFLGEVLEGYHIIGALFIAFGIYLSIFLRHSKT